jgi:peptide/nickel transport system ATP-binding protein
MSLLSIRLTVSYPQRAKLDVKKVLDDFHLDIQPGEAVGLIGESGSGKSTLALALLRLLHLKGGTAAGWILWKGRDLMQLREREMRSVRGREIALVLQSAATSLNPALKIETQFREAWAAHSSGRNWSEGRERARGLLEEVNLPGSGGFLGRYPREISIGQAQRVLIALSLLHRPELLIADEPTSALDVITQREVLELLNRLRREHGMATLFISHDLLSVAAFCHRVAILENGRIVEQGVTEAIFENPSHPYTQRLIHALPERPRPFVEEDDDAQEEASDLVAASLAGLASLTGASDPAGKVIPFPHESDSEYHVAHVPKHQNPSPPGASGH